MAIQTEPKTTAQGFAKASEALILSSRWLLLIFYGVLVLAVALYALAFVVQFIEFAPKVLTMTEDQVILEMLGLVDAALVASLVIMVIISGYDNFIQPFAAGVSGLEWVGSLDSGGLKIKIAASIVAITSIKLLEVMLNATHYTDVQIAWAVGLHLTFVLSAVGLGVLDRLTRH